MACLILIFPVMPAPADMEQPATEAGDAVKPAIGAGDAVKLTIIKAKNKRDKIVAKIIVPAPMEHVWRVMTDYNQLSEFIPDLKVSKVLDDRGNDKIIYQQGATSILGIRFKVSVTLGIAENDHDRISFTQIEGDFDYFEGEWLFEPLNGGKTLVTFVLTAKPGIYVPGWIIRYIWKRDIPRRLQGLREGILSR